MRYPAYDAAGNRLARDDEQGTTSYAYDALHRLVSADPPGAAPAVHYAYDRAGNRLASGEQDAGGAFTAPYQTYSYEAGLPSTIASHRLSGIMRTIRMRWLPWLVIFFAGIVPGAMAVGYLFATRADAYFVALELIQHDPAIRSRMGQLETSRLAFFDGYHYSTFGTDAKAEYRFVLRGGGQKAALDLVLRRQAGRWSLSEGTLRTGNEDPILLDPRELP